MWNPKNYLKFANERLRPALELLARAAVMAGENAPKRVVDLGCGAGNVVPYIKQVSVESCGLNVNDFMLALIFIAYHVILI